MNVKKFCFSTHQESNWSRPLSPGLLWCGFQTNLVCRWCLQLAITSATSSCLAQCLSFRQNLTLPKEAVMLHLCCRREELGPWVVHLLHNSSYCILGSLVIDVLRVCSQNHGKEFASCVKIGLNVTSGIPAEHNGFRKLEQKSWGENCSSHLCWPSLCSSILLLLDL